MDLKKMLIGIFFILLAIYTIIFSTALNSTVLFYISIGEVLIGFVYFSLGCAHKD